MTTTAIEWCDKVWNPTRGCSRVSPGCGGGLGDPVAGGCYAERQAARFSGPGMPYEGLVRIGKQGPRWTGVVRLVADKLSEPLGWKNPARIFVNSMSDLFHEALTNEEIGRVFGVMAACPQHQFLVLTKRAARMRQWFEWVRAQGSTLPSLVGTSPSHDTTSTEASTCVMLAGDRLLGSRAFMAACNGSPWPLRNVWLGVSAEDQKRADERIPELLRTPAAVRFVSYEPALGPVDFTPWLFGSTEYRGDDTSGFLASKADLDWIICGSESGPGARPMDVAWARTAADQCLSAGVAFFTKQIATPEGRAAGVPKGGDPRYWPPGEWPRQFPEVRQ